MVNCMIKKCETCEKVLETIGATEVEGYYLINNYGYHFNIGDRRYDVRFWANEYGYCPNEWRTTTCGRDSMKADRVDRTIITLVDYVFNTSDLDD